MTTTRLYHLIAIDEAGETTVLMAAVSLARALQAQEEEYGYLLGTTDIIPSGRRSGRSDEEER